MSFSSYATIVLAVLWASSAQAAEGPPGHTHGHQGGAAHGATGTDGQPGKPSDVKRVVQVEAGDTTFNVRMIQVRAGETIKFVVTNKSKIDHEFAIASPKENAEHREMMKQMPDMKHDEPNVVTVKPGETKELLWKFGRDADVEFACNIPGHWEGGMKGMFRVSR
jgi:uncharacterized cupredoxin-like copper-binding protein